MASSAGEQRRTLLVSPTRRLPGQASEGELTPPTSRAGQHLRQVLDLDLATAAPQTAANVHQAAGVGGDDEIGPGLLDECRLITHHRAADAGEAHRERPAEPATLVSAFQRQQLQPA